MPIFSPILNGILKQKFYRRVSLLFLLFFLFSSSSSLAWPKSEESFPYWRSINRYSTKIMMSPAEIAAYNKSIEKINPSMTDIFSMSSYLTSKDINNSIVALSVLNTSRVNEKGKVLQKTLLEKNLNLGGLEPENPVHYGVAIRRSALRTFPTWEKALSQKNSTQDFFMESAVYPWEALAIFHTSADGQWYFARMYNYTGWIPTKDVALGEKSKIQRWTKNFPFVVVTAAQFQLDGTLWDMGTRVPIMKDHANQYEVLLPQKDAQGNLQTKTAFWNKSSALSLGYLPYTQDQLIDQALKFRGEVYGWGGSQDARDCSAFIADIHRSFGIFLPRNTSEQGEKTPGMSFDFQNNKTYVQRSKLMKSLPPGTAVYMKGHTMLYLGLEQEGTPMFIHQFAGFYTSKGKYVSAMGCHITTGDIKTSSGKSFLELCYSAKTFRTK